MRTHYDNLQVARNASPGVIKNAYRALVQQWHPDKHPNDTEEASRKVKVINRAYEVLSDPVQRQKHDKWIVEQERKKEPQQGSDDQVRPTKTVGELDQWIDQQIRLRNYDRRDLMRLKKELERDMGDPDLWVKANRDAKNEGQSPDLVYREYRLREFEKARKQHIPKNSGRYTIYFFFACIGGVSLGSIELGLPKTLSIGFAVVGFIAGWGFFIFSIRWLYYKFRWFYNKFRNR